MSGPHFRCNFFLTALRHCLLLKASGSMSDFLESFRDYLSLEKFEFFCYFPHTPTTPHPIPVPLLGIPFSGSHSF